MSGRRRQSLSPSLFPFLAVLVCTLGTLILFLALVAQNATEAAEQNARAERVAQAKLEAIEAKPVTPRLTAKTVQSMLDEEQFRVEQLVAFRDKQTGDMEDRRDQLTHLEDHIERVRQKLKLLSDEVDHAMGETTVEKVEDDTIAAIRERIASERANVEKLRSESENQTPRVVIVPHKGPNGTDRRPVYLECTDQGLTIWPEGSHITMTQLEDANFSANPLDAALRAVRLHAMQNYGDTTPPYPLLVVRPDGIESYAAARGAMQDWDDQFGYELVPADVKLAFATPDPNLKQRVDLAIRDAAAKQHARHSIARRALGGGSDLSGWGDRSGVTRGGGHSGRLPTLSAAKLDRAGRASGFRSHRDSSQIARSPYTGSSPYVSGSRYGSQGVSQHGSFSGNSAAPNGDEAAAEARKWAEEMRTAAREMREANGVDGAGDASGTGNAVDDGTGNGVAESNSSSRPQYSQLPQVNPHATGGKSGEQIGELGSDSGSDSKDGVSDAEGSGDSRSGSSESNPLTPPSSSESQSAGSQVAGDQASGAGGSQSSPSQPSSMTMPQSGSANAPMSSESAAAGAPKIGISTASSQQVRRQGRDWAIPPSMAGIHGNAIVRTIRVQCDADRFVLLPRTSGGATEIFDIVNGDVEQATLRLATAVRDRIERWGPALTGGRWEPRLDVIVMPRGQTRFHQLRTMMIGSGVEVTGRASQ